MKAPFVALLVLLSGTAAWAGYTNPLAVTVTSSSAYGSLTGARDSSDSTQYIGCALNWYGSGFYYGSCSARNSSGTSISCITTDPEMKEAISGLSSYGYASFTVSNGQCASVHSFTYSQYLP